MSKSSERNPGVSPAPSAPPPRKKRRPLLRALAVSAWLILALGGYAVWDAWQFLHTPPSRPGKDVVVNIEPGSTLADVAARLAEAGVVSDPLRFQILARVQDKAGRLQAGRFLVNTGWTPQKALDWLVSGRAMLYRVTVPEGLPWWEVGRILEQAGMCRAEDFAAVIRDPEFLAHWGIPFSSAEGFLYPDTYFMPQPREQDMRAARSAAARMVDTFWKRTAGLWPQGRPDPQTLRRELILASIVEKETGVPAERFRVAGVYVNRLKKNMLLQADPTVIYGLGPEFSGPLLRRHLEDESNAYNTYRQPGLPPGPICSPGAAALRAALEPEAHNYLYFVASGRDGSHVFSSTLSQHNRAVRAYRKAVRGGGK